MHALSNALSTAAFPFALSPWMEAVGKVCTFSVVQMFAQPLCNPQHTSGAKLTLSLTSDYLAGTELAFHVIFDALGTQKLQGRMHTLLMWGLLSTGVYPIRG